MYSDHTYTTPTRAASRHDASRTRHFYGALQSAVTQRKSDVTTWDKNWSLTLHVTRLFMLVAYSLVMTRICVWCTIYKIKITVACWAPLYHFDRISQRWKVIFLRSEATILIIAGQWSPYFSIFLELVPEHATAFRSLRYIPRMFRGRKADVDGL